MISYQFVFLLAIPVVAIGVLKIVWKEFAFKNKTYPENLFYGHPIQVDSAIFEKQKQSIKRF